MCCQAAQLVYVIDDRLIEVAEDANQEKALKEVVVATVKDKGKAVEATEKKARAFEKARILAELRLTKMDVKLGSTELKLAEMESLNLAQVDEITDLKAALITCKLENSVEPIVYQARRHGFGEGWMAALQAMGVLDDSPLRNPKQIPFPEPPPPV